MVGWRASISRAEPVEHLQTPTNSSANSMLAHNATNTTVHPTVNPFLNSSPHQPYMGVSPAVTPMSNGGNNSHLLDTHQDRALDDCLENTQKHAYFLKQHLDGYKLRDALKSASQMISELRTTQLGPQNYYELYNSVITELRELESYLRDDLGLGHKAAEMNGANGTAHTAVPIPTIVDLYETVQHAGNILPRLYLLVTVASVYVEQSPDLTRDILYDLLELCKGVQHPIHGLFLRHHLLTMCKDKLPDDGGAAASQSTASIDNTNADATNQQSSSSPSITSISTSTVKDAIEFILQNFSSMTKLWVRIQQQRTSDKVRRERERKNLRQLVGTNLVRLSELSSITIDVYTQSVLPRILQQIIDSKDTIAQEYLMEVLVHVFPAEYHLAALEPYLAAIRQLEPTVQIKDILIAMMNRLATFAKQSEVQSATTDAEPTATAKTDDSTESELKAEPAADSDEIVDVTLDEDEKPAKQPAMDETTQKLHSTKLFNTFFRYVTQIVNGGSNSSLSDALGMYVALLNFATNVYPQHPQYIDQIHNAALELVQSRTASDQQALADNKTVQSIQQLLNIPLSTLGIDGVLHLQHYSALVQFMPYVERRNFAAQLMQQSIDQYERTVQPPEEAETEGEEAQQPTAREYTVSEVETLLQYVAAVIRDDRTESLLSGSADQTAVDDLEHEQTLVCKWFYTLYNSDTRTQLQIFATCRKQFGHGGPRRVGRTLQVLVQRCLQLLLSISHADGSDPLIRKLLSFTTETISALHSTHSELALRLYLQSALTINSLPNDVNTGNESTIYDNVAAAFTVYEEDISENQKQISALTLLINTLMKLHSLSAESYETLTSKITQASARLLRKPDQCKAIASCAHLFWPVDDTVHKRQHAEEDSKSQAQPQEGPAKADDESVDSNGSSDTTTPSIYTHRDAKRTLACLQKSLKIANTCIGQQQLELFLHLLQQYIYFYQHQCSSVQPKYLNGLIQLVHEQLSNGSIGDDSAEDQKLQQWFDSVLAMLRLKQSDSNAKEDDKQRWNEITIPPTA